MKQIIRTTRSVCPVCLKNLPAQLRREEDGRILLEKTCPEHGPFQVPVWRGLMDFDRWLLGTAPLPETQGRRCPAREAQLWSSRIPRGLSSSRPGENSLAW